MEKYSAFVSLICPECGEEFDGDIVCTFCEACASPLEEQYDLASLSALAKESISKRAKGVWRWHELLPLRDPANRVILREGNSPLLEAPRLASQLKAGQMRIKDESGQPTASFKARTDYWEGAKTIAAGLRVPGTFADRQILAALRESGGTAVAVTDEEILLAQTEIAALEGIFPAPEGAATFAAAKRLRDSGWLKADDHVVLYNTGSGLKYI